MIEPVVSMYDTKKNLFLKFWVPSLQISLLYILFQILKRFIIAESNQYLIFYFS